MFQDNHTRCKAKQSIIMIITSVSFPSFFYGVRIAYSFRFLCCFVCLRSVSCTQCCLCLWIVHYWLPLPFSRTFISTCSHIPVSYFYLHDLTVQILVPVINNAVKIITWYLQQLRFSQFSGCWLILSVYIIMSIDFPFVRLLGVR
jgi:hypothetical protein